MMDMEQQRQEPSLSNRMDYASAAPSSYSSGSHQHFSYPTASIYSSQQNSIPMPPPPRPLQVPQETLPSYLPAANQGDIVARVGNFAVIENSKCTNALVGQTFVQPANVDYKGKKSLMFVFAVGYPSFLYYYYVR